MLIFRVLSLLLIMLALSVQALPALAFPCSPAMADTQTAAPCDDCPETAQNNTSSKTQHKNCCDQGVCLKCGVHPAGLLTSFALPSLFPAPDMTAGTAVDRAWITLSELFRPPRNGRIA